MPNEHDSQRERQHKNDLLIGALISLLFFLGDYYASHVDGGYTILESVHTIRDMSAVSCHTGVVARSTESTDGKR
jgi:hypothetical protein